MAVAEKASWALATMGKHWVWKYLLNDDFDLSFSLLFVMGMLYLL
jgi:hypothetical protein